MILFAGIVQSKFKPCNLSKLGIPTSSRGRDTDQAPAHAIAYVVPWDLNSTPAYVLEIMKSDVAYFRYRDLLGGVRLRLSPGP